MKTIGGILTLSLGLLLFPCIGNAQHKKDRKIDAVSGASHKSENVKSGFQFSGYGTVNYHNYLRSDSDIYQKDKFDLERFVLYANYRFNDWITLKSEFEWEHGGTGATMEFDSQEESGEYEIEVEQGGEVKLERLFLDFSIDPRFNVRVGRMKIHIGMAQTLDRPTQYFTVLRPEMENEILPIGWYETGLQAYGGFFKNKLTYELSMTSGLDATGFNSRNWIKLGYQTRFEMPNAESFAYSGTLNYHFGKHKDTFVGISGYVNNTVPNRPKDDLPGVDGYVKIIEGHVSVNEKGWRFNAIGLFGDLQNSEIISTKNRSLSNQLNVKRTPVGKQALGFSTELGYNILPLFRYRGEQKLFPYARLDWYDTMFATEGEIIKKPNWKRQTYTIGLNWFINKNIVFKAEVQDRKYGSKRIDRVTGKDLGGNNRDALLSFGMGYSF